MPGKYHIKIRQTEPRFAPVSKFSSIEIEGCIGCLECVKRTACIYDVYTKRRFDPVQIVDTADVLCLSCMRCVQECKKGLLSRTINPDYERLGDDYWTPDLLARIWKQAESGKIPVSGSGYQGPFTGPGFDGMWTDMSEIVRPTRDGIHGREYISTVIDLGKRPICLEFDELGNLKTEMPPSIEIPIPMILDIPPSGIMGKSTRLAITEAAKQLGTLAVAGLEESKDLLAGYSRQLIVKFDPVNDDPSSINSNIPVIEVPFSDKCLETAEKIKSIFPHIIVSIRLPLDEYALERSIRLVNEGAEILHLQAGYKGRGQGKRSGDFVTTLMREMHQGLVEKGIRERITILISGGIAMAEHAAKIIICGADGVGIDTALLAAMECRLFSDCDASMCCPVHIDRVPVGWGAQRIVNLFGSWHSQLLEVLGAMGLREVRRLRGETGRAMFFEDLERECFSPIFARQTPMPFCGATKDENKVLFPEQTPMPVQGATKDENTDLFSGPKKSKCETIMRHGDKEGNESNSPLLAFKKGRVERGNRGGLSKENLINQIDCCPSRFRNPITKYRVVRTSDCIACGKCVDVCAYGVYRMGGARMLTPLSHLCCGPDICRFSNRYCADHCPKGAIRVGISPMWHTIGDPRWTADLIVGTWRQAETGSAPDQGLEYRIGESGGGFDKIDFVFPNKPIDPNFSPDDVDLSIPLNRRGDNRPEVTIGFPIYGGGMSFGAISLATIISRARAYKVFGSFTCTGEGGYPEELTAYKDNVITQVATGLFGVREETIQRARIVEFKYAQGAKPGLGGHLLGDKVTPSVARMREAVEGSSLFSPFPFHSVYSVEDHKKHVDWIKQINPEALIAVKVSTPVDVDMVAVGSYYAGAHIIHLDGSYGGTGAAPDIAKKNIAMPIEYAIPKVHNFLIEEGIRDKMTLIASGGLRTAWDVAKAIALGADGVVICTAEMVALECIRCGNCESGRGCPRGIATTDRELSNMYDTDWATQRLINLFYSWHVQIQEILWRLGMNSVRELVGRADLLIHQDYI